MHLKEAMDGWAGKDYDGVARIMNYIAIKWIKN